MACKLGFIRCETSDRKHTAPWLTGMSSSPVPMPIRLKLWRKASIKGKRTQSPYCRKLLYENWCWTKLFCALSRSSCTDHWRTWHKWASGGTFLSWWQMPTSACRHSWRRNISWTPSFSLYWEQNFHMWRIWRRIFYCKSLLKSVSMQQLFYYLCP